MRSALSSFACLAFCLYSGTLHAAPGYSWEIGMEMEGMPFPMPKQTVCTPKASKEPPVSAESDDCKILEKKLSGNHFHWKAQCKDGLTEGDITSTPTSYSGSMKMTEKSGEIMSMKMSGKRLGACEYKNPKEVMDETVGALKKQYAADFAQGCPQALEAMNGSRMESPAGSIYGTLRCTKEIPIFCQRIRTPEGYDKAVRAYPITQSATAHIAKLCNLDTANLLAKFCPDAVQSKNLEFVARYCPKEKADLAHKYCEGRDYTSRMESGYAELCKDSSSGEGAPGPNGQDSATPQQDPPASSGSSDADVVKKGMKQLRGFFGF
jgi:hypothetical protein